jgi:hypothetical protein
MPVYQPSRDKGVLQHMLRIQMIGLALAAAIVMSALAAGSASAENWQWLLFHSETGVHLLLSKEELVETEGLVLLEDSKATGGAVSVHCHGFGLGTIGPHALDLTLSITAEPLGTKKSVPCTFDKVGLCKSGTTPTVEAVHLPWHTKLLELEGKPHDEILGNGAGKPGWKFTCTNVLGGTTEDECIEEEGIPNSLLVENDGQLGVLARFGSEFRLGKCSLGGAEAGIVAGTVLTKSPSARLLVLISPLP